MLISYRDRILVVAAVTGFLTYSVGIGVGLIAGLMSLAAMQWAYPVFYNHYLRPAPLASDVFKQYIISTLKRCYPLFQYTFSADTPPTEFFEIIKTTLRDNPQLTKDHTPTNIFLNALKNLPDAKALNEQINTWIQELRETLIGVNLVNSQINEIIESNSTTLGLYYENQEPLKKIAELLNQEGFSAWLQKYNEDILIRIQNHNEPNFQETLDKIQEQHTRFEALHPKRAIDKLLCSIMRVNQGEPIIANTWSTWLSTPHLLQAFQKQRANLEKIRDSFDDTALSQFTCELVRLVSQSRFSEKVLENFLNEKLLPPQPNPEPIIHQLRNSRTYAYEPLLAGKTRRSTSNPRSPRQATPLKSRHTKPHA